MRRRQLEPPPADRRPAVDPAADRREALRLVPVSRETEARLAIYVERLGKWQAVKNLVGPATLPTVWTRHIADSAQLLDHAPDARRWVDLGSGAGFPGLVIAIMLAGRPGAHVDLVESNQRKCAFLREVVRDTGAPARVHPGRIEDVVATLAGPIEIVTSRALAPVTDLIVLAAPLLDAGATGLFLVGDGPSVARPGWQIAVHPSKTHAAGRVVMVRRDGS